MSITATLDRTTSESSPAPAGTPADDRPATASAAVELRAALKALIASSAEPSLLLQLAEAIAASTGRGSGRGGTRSTRVPINVAALELDTQINSWARARLGEAIFTPVRREVSSKAALGAWGDTLAKRIRNGHVSEHEVRAWVRVLRSYAAQIRHLLTPHRVIEISGSCTECGATITTKAGGTAHALTGVVRISGMAVRCGACRSEWAGEATLRALAEFI